MDDRTIGLDFGTSTTLATYREGAAGRPVPIGHVDAWMPSLAAPSPEGWVIGEEAEALYPATIRSVKRAITQESKTVLDADGRSHDADPVIVSMLTEARLLHRTIGGEVDRCSCRPGCPAMWDGDQRMRLVNAAVAAGIDADIATLMDEPVSAGLAWVRQVERETGRVPSGLCLVFDCGGGTLDVAVLDCERPTQRGGGAEITVLSADGMGRAGDHIDERFADLLVAESTEMRSLGRGLQLLIARELKEKLLGSEKVVHTRSIGRGTATVQAHRSQLDGIVSEYMDEALRLCAALLRGARLREPVVLSPPALRAIPEGELFGSVAHVVMCGGSSALMAIGSTLRAAFPNAAFTVFGGSRLRSVIAEGLSMDDDTQRLNLHRPGFHLELRQGDRKETVYRAHTPLYTPASVMRGETPVYSAPLKHMTGRWSLWCMDPQGRSVGFVHGASSADSLSVELTPYSLFELRPNGGLRVGPLSCRIHKWPVIRRTGTPQRPAALQVEAPDELHRTKVLDAFFK